ncbi:homeobox protein siamois-like [Anomaloglossus baeobatrachus]
MEKDPELDQVLNNALSLQDDYPDLSHPLKGKNINGSDTFSQIPLNMDVQKPLNPKQLQDTLVELYSILGIPQELPITKPFNIGKDQSTPPTTCQDEQPTNQPTNGIKTLTKEELGMMKLNMPNPSFLKCWLVLPKFSSSDDFALICMTILSVVKLSCPLPYSQIYHCFWPQLSSPISWVFSPGFSCYGPSLMSSTPCLFSGMLSVEEMDILKRSKDEKEDQAPSTSGQKSRKRTLYNKQQTIFLQNQFDFNPYPNYVSRCCFAKITGIPEPRIQVWFQNRRARYPSKPSTSQEAGGAVHVGGTSPVACEVSQHSEPCKNNCTIYPKGP